MKINDLRMQKLMHSESSEHLRRGRRPQGNLLKFQGDLFRITGKEAYFKRRK